MILRDMTTTTTNLVLEKALDASSLRHKLIANNIANVNTPGYKRTDMVFQEELRKALDCSPGWGGDKGIHGSSVCMTETGTFCFRAKKSNSRHWDFGVPRIEELEPSVNKFNNLIYRNDENCVDIDREVAEMTKNSLYYNVIARRLTQQYQMLNTIISKGGGA